MFIGKYTCQRCQEEVDIDLTFFQAFKIALGIRVSAPYYCKSCLDMREAFKNYVKTK